MRSTADSVVDRAVPSTAAPSRASSSSTPMKWTKVADEKEVERAAVDADRHAQRHSSGARLDPADATHSPLHLERRTAGAPLVLEPLEEEQHRVAAPLDHPCTEAVGGREKLGEA